MRSGLSVIKDTIFNITSASSSGIFSKEYRLFLHDFKHIFRGICVPAKPFDYLHLDCSLCVSQPHSRS